MEYLEPKEAIMLFSQSEKIKIGLIWASQMLELISNLTDEEKRGGERIIHSLLNMVVQEAGLGQRILKRKEWEEIHSSVQKAIIMIDSGVAGEAVYHLTRALSKTTNFGNLAMSSLRENNLL